jgi:hypothetical protein
MPKSPRKKKPGIPYTEKHAEVFKALSDILAGAYGQEAQDYFREFAKLIREYQRLIDRGVNVKVSRKRNGRSLLVIEN